MSAATVVGSTPWRLALEAVQIALHRQQHRRSPTANFGRMPPGFRISSGNNAKLVAAGKRFRGGRCDGREACHELGIPPIGPLTGNPQDTSWCGFGWSPWKPMNTVLQLGSSCGLYRMRGDDPEALLYVGQGVVAVRLAAHLAKTRIPGHAQGAVLAAQKRFECSFALSGAWTELHRLELETDLIAAHALATGSVPPAQFIG